MKGRVLIDFITFIIYMYLVYNITSLLVISVQLNCLNTTPFEKQEKP